MMPTATRTSCGARSVAGATTRATSYLIIT
jgi:hypothetical protein